MQAHPRSPLASLTVLAISLLFLALPAAAFEVPFDNGTGVDTNTNRGFSTFPADLDGDGDLDLLSAVSNSTLALASASWWENTNGLGTAWTERAIITSSDVSSVHAGDVDGDGDLDILLAIFTGSDVIVYRNDNGLGTALTPLNVDTSSHGPRLAIFSDMDRDGDLDVVVAANTTGTKDVSWYENTAGDGSAWTIHTVDATMNGARGLLVADIDADGDPDIVSAAEFDDKVVFYENTAGTGLTWTEIQVNTAVFDAGSNIVAEDLDGDGDLDLAGVAETAANCLWWENTAGDGSVWAEHFVSPSVPGAYGLAAGDLDFDGDIDLVTAGRIGGARADWWENPGDASTWTQHLIESGIGNARSAAVGDINGDGWLDVAVNTDTRLEWWRNEAIHRNTPFLQTRDLDLASGGAFDLKAADLDRDGDLDLVGNGKTADRVVAYRNTAGDGTAFTTTNVATGFDGAHALDLGDVDRDGKVDVVGSAEAAGDLVWWRNADGLGTSFTATNIDINFPGARGVKLADIDGDGDLDLAAASSGGDELAFFRNTNGDGSLWNKITALSFFDQATGADAGDIDGDGDLDLVGSAFGDDDLAWARNVSGDGSSWMPTTIATTFDGASTVKLADVDTDGDLDLVATAELGDAVSWFENTAGDGSAWTEHSIATAIDGARGAQVTDFDQDGDWDVAVGQANGTGRVIVYLNEPPGNGTSWSTLTVDDAFAGAALVSAADVDGDGRPDILAAAETDGDLQWFRNGGGQVALPTVNSSPGALGNSVTDDLLRVDLRHNGRTGEQAAELANLELRFEDGSAIALDSSQANGIIESLSLYLDNGDATWTVADTLLQTDSVLSLTAGVHTMTLTDGDANLSVAIGGTKTYWVVVQTTATYSTQPFGAFRMIHLTQSTSRVEDRVNDTPLRLEYQANVSSNLLVVNPSGSSADIQIQSVTDAPDPVTAGTQLTYTVTVTNGGTGPADNVSVTSTLPSGVTFSSTDGCQNDPSGNPTCNLGTVGAGATVAFDLVVDVGASTTGPLNYSASVTSTTPDTNPGNNSGNASTTVVKSGDLALAIGTPPPGTYPDGGMLYYTIFIINVGPSDLVNSLVNDTFPAQLTGVAWTCTATAGSSCTASGTGNLVNSPVSLKVGAVAAFRVRGTVTDGTTASLSNTATVTDPNDPFAGNNSQSVNVIWGNPIFFDGFESGNTAAWQ
jgi:uncharacterized repeat protein (TIGR01451 family)